MPRILIYETESPATMVRAERLIKGLFGMRGSGNEGAGYRFSMSARTGYWSFENPVVSLAPGGTEDAAVNGILNESGYPEIQFAEAIKEGNIAKFFEQAFDWQHMAYIFYPTHYGRKNNWLTIESLKDNDPVFQNFLKAGMARVVVPATIGFEPLLQYYWAFTRIFTLFTGSSGFPHGIFSTVGSFAPGVHDVGGPWQPIAIELMQNAELVDDVVYDDEGNPINLVGTYVNKVPTNLVYLASPDGTPPGDLPDNSEEPEIAPYI